MSCRWSGHGDILAPACSGWESASVSHFLAGVPAGLLIGRIAWLDRASSTAIQFFRMISPLSWMPIAVMVLGIGDAPIYFLLAVSAVWPILLSTAEGVRSVDRRWIEMARSLGATEAEVLRHVVIPAVAAHVVTGLRLGLGVRGLYSFRRKCWVSELDSAMRFSTPVTDWLIPNSWRLSC